MNPLQINEGASSNPSEETLHFLQHNILMSTFDSKERKHVRTNNMHWLLWFLKCTGKYANPKSNTSWAQIDMCPDSVRFSAISRNLVLVMFFTRCANRTPRPSVIQTYRFKAYTTCRHSDSRLDLLVPISSTVTFIISLSAPWMCFQGRWGPISGRSQKRAW